MNRIAKATAAPFAALTCALALQTATPAQASMDDWRGNAATPAVQIAVGSDMTLSDALTANGVSLSGAASLVKTGSGTVTVDDASGIGSFAGDIHVFQGGWQVGTSAGFGTSDGSTWVYPNGCVLVTDVTVSHSGEIFHLAGTGKHDWYGWGAIRFPTDTQQNNAMAVGAYGSRWILEDDATVMVSGNGNGRSFLPAIDLELNGHDLTFWRGRYGKVAATYSAPSQYGMFSSITGSGNIIMENGVTFLASGFDPPSYTEGNGLVLRNAMIAFEKSKSREGWRLTASPLPAADWDDPKYVAANLRPSLVLRNLNNKNYNGEHDANVWRGPVTLEGDLDIWQADQNYAYSMTLPNKVTGTGGLNVITGKAWLYLDNPENDFQGGVRLSGPNNRLVLAADGALPADGGRLLLTDSSVAFPSTVSAPWSLPALELGGTSVVQNCQGSWKSVTALAGADAKYNSFLGASNLILRSGSKLTLKSFFDPADYPGWEERYDVNRSTTDFDSLPQTGIRLYPYYMENNDFRDIKDSNNATRTGTRTIAYATYLWNHGTSDETWTFAGHFGSHVYVWLNGQQILALTAGNAWRNPYRVTGTLHPGANRLIVLSDNCSWGATSDTRESDIGTWAGVNNKGFVYAVGDVPLTDSTLFHAPTDPGDGSFCTTKCGDDALDGISWGATFTALSMAPDSLLDLGGRDYTFAEFENAGTVVSNGNATVTSSWTIDCSQVAFDDWAPSTFTGTLTIGDNAEIVLENALSWPREFDIEIATAGAAINRAPSVRVVGGYPGNNVKAELTGAGNTTLKLSSARPVLKLSFR
ncbi:MAG: hypothetical protein ILM98_12560 [Kiritimatiellae bacterium]|nr:hypothetical protein [Kiritimatiellia bacterium]